MKKTMIYTAFLVAGAALAWAQEQDHIFMFQEKVPGPSVGFRGKTVKFVSGQLVGSAVKASPYSAESVIESTQALADGNRIVNRSVTKQYRDSEGRERREMSLESNGDVVMISDPVAGTSYTLHMKEKTAEKMPMAELGPMSGGVAAGIAGPGLLDFSIHVQPRTLFINRENVATVGGASATTNEENLGARVIEGVMAQGTRTRNTIPAGQIGNERPLEIVTETWYSPDLKMTVLSETSDPRMGKTVMKLINISRAEPSRTLFEVPSGYAVSEGGMGRIVTEPGEPGRGVDIFRKEIRIE